MIWKLFCHFFGHKFFYPEDKNIRGLVGGICQRCLALTKLPLEKRTGSVVVWKRLESGDEAGQ